MKARGMWIGRSESGGWLLSLLPSYQAAYHLAFVNILALCYAVSIIFFNKALMFCYTPNQYHTKKKCNSTVASKLVPHPRKYFCLEPPSSTASGWGMSDKGLDFLLLYSNLQAATDCPNAILSFIIKDLQLECIAGPVLEIPLANSHTSPVRSVPTKLDGIFHMLTDLFSHSHGQSINYYISARANSFPLRICSSRWYGP